MQLAPAGSSSESHYGGAQVNAMFTSYLLFILIVMIVIVIIEGNNDGGAA